MLHVQESVNLTIYLYAQTMGQRRMLYIRKFYVVKNIYISIYIHRWDTGTQLQWRAANMARNDLRAGGLGGREAPPPTRGVARSATPTASTYIYMVLSYIYIGNTTLCYKTPWQKSFQFKIPITVWRPLPTLILSSSSVRKDRGYATSNALCKSSTSNMA